MRRERAAALAVGLIFEAACVVAVGALVVGLAACFVALFQVSQ
jgi:hypothetical protein